MEDEMRSSDSLGEEFVRLALAVDEHLPGYVDSFFGPEAWREQAREAGKVPLDDLKKQADRLADAIAQSGDVDEQRRDFLARQAIAMQMSLRLLSGEKVSLAEEVQAVYDVQPAWKDEASFEEAHKALDHVLPPGGSLRERLEQWKKSLEISLEKAKELLPYVTNMLRERTRKKFDLPEHESFIVEFVTDQPWMAYNWYLGEFRSRIDINLDHPLRITGLPELIAHEAYPGHHTELVTKEQGLVREKNYVEHLMTLINAPSCVIAEGIATSALETLFTDSELEEWYREELLPRAGLAHIDPSRILEIHRAAEKGNGLWGNAVFMLHDQKKPTDDIKAYLLKYGLHTEKEAEHALRFISDPLGGSYTFTYHVGYDLLTDLFACVDRDTYFARLLQEPVTPSQVRQWIDSESRRT
jgi:hypothetical protein